ncbi:hypothetical protein ZHAS_00011653 [Anopheles sinensis]|uniref:Uncharacterized protein n=1 Tax=Anopheles sinensis TaxID=74873 RepID=A0A084W0R7_ANOSI|nr:hypothetical protein ZHAS_00011653 [Anopheles sinensis]
MDASPGRSDYKWRDERKYTRKPHRESEEFPRTRVRGMKTMPKIAATRWSLKRMVERADGWRRNRKPTQPGNTEEDLRSKTIRSEKSVNGKLNAFSLATAEEGKNKGPGVGAVWAVV